MFTADWASRVRSSEAYSQSAILCAGHLGLVYRVLQASIHDLKPWFNSPNPKLINLWPAMQELISRFAAPHFKRLAQASDGRCHLK